MIHAACGQAIRSTPCKAAQFYAIYRKCEGPQAIKPFMTPGRWGAESSQTRVGIHYNPGNLIFFPYKQAIFMFYIDI